MPLINCEISFILTWSANCVIFATTGATTYGIKDTKHYIPVVVLSSQVNGKLLQQSKSVFKRTIICNKYQSDVKKNIS